MSIITKISFIFVILFGVYFGYIFYKTNKSTNIQEKRITFVGQNEGVWSLNTVKTFKPKFNDTKIFYNVTINFIEFNIGISYDLNYELRVNDNIPITGFKIKDCDDDSPYNIYTENSVLNEREIKRDENNEINITFISTLIDKCSNYTDDKIYKILSDSNICESGKVIEEIQSSINCKNSCSESDDCKGYYYIKDGNTNSCFYSEVCENTVQLPNADEAEIFQSYKKMDPEDFENNMSYNFFVDIIEKYID